MVRMVQAPFKGLSPRLGKSSPGDPRKKSRIFGPNAPQKWPKLGQNVPQEQGFDMPKDGPERTKPSPDSAVCSNLLLPSRG